MDEAEADVLAFMTFPRIIGLKSIPSIRLKAHNKSDSTFWVADGLADTPG